MEKPDSDKVRGWSRGNSFFFLLLRVLLSEDLLCQAARQKRARRWPRLTAGRIECNFPRAVCMAAYRGGRDVCRRGGGTI